MDWWLTVLYPAISPCLMTLATIPKIIPFDKSLLLYQPTSSLMNQNSFNACIFVGSWTGPLKGREEARLMLSSSKYLAMKLHLRTDVAEYISQCWCLDHVVMMRLDRAQAREMGENNLKWAVEL